MTYELTQLQEKIIAHPYFQKTKTVIENNVCHPNESVSDHLLATAKRAEEAVTGEFITDKKAQDLFRNWLKEEHIGIQTKEIVFLVALLHDIGKIMVYEENGRQTSINEKQKDGQTRAFGHEYWGGAVAQEILIDVGTKPELAKYIANLVKLHDTFTFSDVDKEKTTAEYIALVKAKGRGFEKEILFNTYVDLAVCSLFENWIQIVKQLFSSETLYQKRRYFVV